MEKFIIEKNSKLKGTVKISGSKNSVLPILAATLLSTGKCVIHGVPFLKDVIVMKQILENLGAEIEYDEKKCTIKSQISNITNFEPSYDLVTQMRASFLVMGAILARKGKVKIPLPGGCPIGSRPIDLHLKGFSALGAEILSEHGFVLATCGNLIGTNIYLDFPSVGATENIMMACVFAEGQTTLQNCAVEPEIVDLANFLNAMGADIRGAGTDTIKINGVTELNGCEHTVIPDRIEAGTFMVAAAITNGDIVLENVVVDHLKPIIAKLKEANVKVEEVENGLRVCKSEDSKLKGVDIKTMPYPGFPTDMQAQFMSLLGVAEGTSIFTETIFENRFMHATELVRMGADIKIDSRTAIIEGVKTYLGAKVKATDLRAGAAMLLSALQADGKSEISEIHHIDRGYYLIEKKLKDLGANIERVKT